MQADESVYLHPGRAKPGPAAMVVGEDDFPDVVLEVDHTTDVHRGKLDRYESWGFPEVWVEVPDTLSPSRPHRRRPGLTIHLLEHGRFRVAAESRAFPGWRAEEIHVALNEPVLSERTSAALQRVAAALGAREGTGPDDDLLLRAQRRQGFEHGHAAGRAEGHAEGRAEARTQMVRQILRSRGIEVSATFDTAPEAFAAASEEALLTAALGCTNEADVGRRVSRPLPALDATAAANHAPRHLCRPTVESVDRDSTCDRNRPCGDQTLLARIHPRGESLQRSGAEQTQIFRAGEHNLVHRLELPTGKEGITNISRDGHAVGHHEREVLLSDCDTRRQENVLRKPSVLRTGVHQHRGDRLLRTALGDIPQLTLDHERTHATMIRVGACPANSARPYHSDHTWRL